MLKKAIYIILILASGFPASAQRNVILIIADDLGTDYCGFYENKMDTVALPNIRRLLERGIRFRKAWSNPLCSPTRAGILTGRHSFRTGVGTIVGSPGSNELDTAEITIPRLLNEYSPGAIAKAQIGKWHLQKQLPANYLFPNKMGYDYYEGCFTGSLNSYTNWTKITNGVSSTVTKYATTETADNAISWIKSHSNNPFFLWLAFNAPHTPYHLPPAGLYSDTTLSGTSADIAAHPKKYFMASIEALDHEIGRVFDTLQSIQKWENTYIIFISDNGDDQLVTQTAGNGKAKGSLYEAGITVPVIIAGPSVVNPGRTSDALITTHDLFATILELMGDTDWQNHIPENKSVDSKSLMPVIKNQIASIRSWAFTEVFGATATGDGKTMRNKDYKLIDFDMGTQKFYNLTLDSLERHDLLSGTLSSTDSSNYLYLCTEMKRLTGRTGFCTLFGEDMAGDYSQLIYPNPFYSYFHFKSTTGNELFYLTDCLGQNIYSGKNIELKDFSYLAKGIYFLKVVDKTTSVVKLLKE